MYDKLVSLILSVTSKHEAEEVNAAGIELLDRFSRVQVLDCKEAVGRIDANWKALRFVLRSFLKLLIGGQKEGEVETSARAPLNGHTSRTYF